MLSFRVTRVVRPAQYRSTRSAGSRVLMAVQYVSTSPVPTARPAERSSAAKLASTAANGAWSATGGDLLQVLPDQVEIVPFFHHGAQGVPGYFRAELGLAEEVEGAHPVDGLGYAGRLGQVQLT